VSDLVSVEAPEDETGLYDEPPEMLARDLWTGARLFTAAAAFFFLTFVFAFFYLRSLNSNGQWRPHGINPPTGWGVGVLACIAASVVIYWVAVRLYVEPRWRMLSVLSLGLGLAAVVIQCVEWAAMSWGPTNGGYASVFIGWTGFYVFVLLGALYWMETLVAESWRDSRGSAEAEARAVVRRANADALALFWSFLGLVEIAAFVTLYLVA
jgi:heme/copper-type cytochrome/quinol oxidase subunit 3